MALSLVLMMLLSAAHAEGREFTLRISANGLDEGIAALLSAAEISGAYAADGDSFHASVNVGFAGQKVPARFEVYGVPSHFGVKSSLLGDTELMINNLALAEFGLKAYNYLGIPLHRASLLIPYVHTSAFEVLSNAVSPLLPREDCTITLSSEDVADLMASLALLCEEDRTVRCYLSALSLDAWTLADDLVESCASGLTIRREGDQLTWTAQGEDLLLFRQTERAFTFTLHVGGSMAYVHADWPDGSFCANIILQGEAFENRLLFDVNAAMHQDGWNIRISDKNGGMELHAALTLGGAAGLSAPDYTADAIGGVNVLSVNGESLADLMAAAALNLIPGFISLVAAAPAQGVQSLMDMLDESGVLAMLSDALLNGSDY